MAADPNKVFEKLKEFASDKNFEDKKELESGDAFLKLQTLMNTIGGDLVMHVNDFPKGTDVLTVITITTEPPIICHGSGMDSTTSRDVAALEVARKMCAMNGQNEDKKSED